MCRPGALPEYLMNLELQQLDSLQRQMLDEPITIEEVVSAAVDQMAHNKTPGTDGFPAEFYAIYKA